MWRSSGDAGGDADDGCVMGVRGDAVVVVVVVVVAAVVVAVVDAVEVEVLCALLCKVRVSYRVCVVGVARRGRG